MSDRPIGELQPMALPAPAFGGCATVFDALKKRSTSRDISDRPIPLQVLADLLWAGQGVNRLHGPFGVHGRTAGSASNSQEILVYAALEQGTHLYDPDAHRLVPAAAGDLRPLAIGPGQGQAGASAPARLIYVVDIERFKNAGFQEPGLYDPEIQKSYYFVDTGLIAQNVALAAAALGLTSWFHNCNRAALAKALGLTAQQRALFGHTLGYAAE
jgi:nitroreductase